MVKVHFVCVPLGSRPVTGQFAMALLVRVTLVMVTLSWPLASVALEEQNVDVRLEPIMVRDTAMTGTARRGTASLTALPSGRVSLRCRIALLLFLTGGCSREWGWPARPLYGGDRAGGLG